jgi:hypothetical protein
MTVDTPPTPGFILGSMVIGLLFIVIVIAMYVLPTVVAMLRKHRQLPAIALVNILFGWSVIGWVAAMIWSLTTPQPQTVIVQTISPTPAPPPQS